MGAFAGSSAILCHQRSRLPRVLTLTINNRCNLSCSHCYLQYDSTATSIDGRIEAALSASIAPHVSIVGMEPLVNKSSAQLLAVLIERLCDAGKNVSFITNGLNAHLLPLDAAARLSWIDVSVDGSEFTYEQYRGAPFSKLQRGVDALRKKGVTSIRLLQTLQRFSLGELQAVIAIREKLGADLAIFSPFVITQHQGTQADLSFVPEDLLSALIDTDPRALSNAWFVSDIGWFGPNNVSPIMSGLRRAFADRIIAFEGDPIRYGMIRLTYEGQLLTPLEAMHTRHYRSIKAHISNMSIDEFFAARTHLEAA